MPMQYCELFDKVNKKVNFLEESSVFSHLVKRLTAMVYYRHTKTHTAAQRITVIRSNAGMK